MCEHRHRRCINTRPMKGTRYRRYHCHDCGGRFSTVEVAVDGLSKNYSAERIAAAMSRFVKLGKLFSEEA